MLRKSSTITAGILLASTLCFADAWNKKTILTVNEPILVPGATLTPGKYVVKLVDSLSDRHIVLITNEREDEVITTILAIPNYRLQPTGDTRFQFWETPIGNPIALRAWFYPGDNFGQEFAYPKGLSAKIAREVQRPVPTIEATAVPELKSAPVTETQPSGEQHAFTPQAYPPPAAPEPVLRAEAAPTPEPAVAPTVESPAPGEPQLPSTASPYATFGVAGLIALMLGITLRFAVRHQY